MTQEQFRIALKQSFDDEFVLITGRNTGYGMDSDAFANLNEVERASHGKISAETGIFTRLSDKFARLANVFFNDAETSEEKLEDTLNDIAGYCRLWKILRKEKLNTNV